MVNILIYNNFFLTAIINDERSNTNKNKNKKKDIDTSSPILLEKSSKIVNAKNEKKVEKKEGNLLLFLFICFLDDFDMTAINLLERSSAFRI